MHIYIVHDMYIYNIFTSIYDIYIHTYMMALKALRKARDDCTATASPHCCHAILEAGRCPC